MDSSITAQQTNGLLILFATVVFGLAVRGGSMTGAAVLVATAILVVAFYRYRSFDSRDLHDADRDFEKRLLLAVILFGVFGSIGWAPSGVIPSSGPLQVMPGLIWTLIAGGLYLTKGELGKQRRFMLVGITLGVTFVVGMLHLQEVFDVGIDVVFLHARAADALATGENPYTDAVVVLDGAPTAEPGDVIEGYVYPPLTALAYAVGYWLFADPRYTSLGAWLVFLTIVGWKAARAPTKHGLYVMLLMAAMPGWPYVLRASWTEPLSLAFIGAGFALWTKPANSGSFWGLALASKQYFAVTAPLLLLNRAHKHWRRAMTAIAVIGVTIGAALVWDAPAFWNAAVDFHTTTPPRGDSSNLIGLIAEFFGTVWDPPTVLTVGLGLLAALLTARGASDAQGFMMGMAITLAVSFLVASQAFANYWFLIGGMCGLVLMSLRLSPRSHSFPQRSEAKDSQEL